MSDNEKTKEQLIAELQEAQQQIEELKATLEALPDDIIKRMREVISSLLTEAFRVWDEVR